ncbi:Fc.00g116250.m01.CDS01 [Cosmosporella sp. VM-42]
MAELQWVNASSRDIKLHEYLVDSGSTSNFGAFNTTSTWDFTSKKQYAPQPVLPSSVNWMPFNLASNEMDLFQYFERIAASALSTFGHDQAELSELLIRMSFSDNTSSSNAVLQAILALSSVHWEGHQNHAALLKIGALRALRVSSSNRDMGRKEAMQHVAAGMILCSLEIQKPTETYSDWLRYGCGVKHVIKAAGLTTSSSDSDSVLLLGWAHYHDVLARFSKRHWRRDAMVDVYGQKVNDPLIDSTCDNPEAPRPSSRPHEILHLLSTVCETILDPSHPRYYAKDYRDSLSLIESRLIKAEAVEPTTHLTQTPKEEIMVHVSELHRLATLAYLERASGNASPESVKVQNWTNKGFRIFSKLRTCRWLFPLLIFGCEARPDQRRRCILDLISRTEKETNVRSLDCIRNLIEGIWVQDDLASGDIMYLDKLRAIMSSSAELPVFV